MATIRRRGKRWQVIVRKAGYPDKSRTFPSKQDAEVWARATEAAMDRGLALPDRATERMTFGDLARDYTRLVIPTLKGADQDRRRLNQIVKTFGPYRLSAINGRILAEFRDKRLCDVSAQTAKHEVSLILRVLKWGVVDRNLILPNGIPVVRMPKLPSGRERRLSDRELEAICQHLKPEQAAMVRFAVETAMRRSELCRMDWDHVCLAACTCRIPETKNGHPRVIPLSSRAVAILNEQPRQITGKVWGISPSGISHAFSSACRKAGIEDARFHDLRHEATSRLFERGLNPMEVSSITGHRSLAMLQRYTHLGQWHLLEKIG